MYLEHILMETPNDYKTLTSISERPVCNLRTAGVTDLMAGSEADPKT